MANAGRVAIVPKGEYNSATAYKRLDLVRYNNAVYVAKKANTGVSPTKTDTWMLCIQNVTQEQYDDLISGAVQVESAKETDNALKLENLTAKQVGESGARNLIPYPYDNESTTVNGVDFTINSDGTIRVKGTATAATQFFLHLSGDKAIPLKAGSYTASGAFGTVKLVMYLQSTNEQLVYARNGATKTFTLSSDDSVNCILGIASGETVDEVIYPMLEIGSVAHPWRPYHFGGAEDSLKLNGLTAEEFVSNENLFINPYFLDPVNPSGKTEWTDATGNFIPKWTFAMSTDSGYESAALTDDGLYMVMEDNSTAYYVNIYQYVSKLEINKKYTISMSIDGEIYTRTITGGTAQAGGIRMGVTTMFYLVESNQDVLFFRLYKTNATSCTINWAKLEPGSIATPFIPPNKELEKLKCGVIDIATHIATDLNTEFDSGFSICKYSSSTLNTPYAEGLTGGYVGGLCLTFGYSTAYGEQLAISGGGNYFLKRKFDNGVFGAWGKVNDGGNADTLDGYHASDFLLSTAINKGTTAPTDTKALWVDTANKVIKAYIDGAWTQVS